MFVDLNASTLITISRIFLAFLMPLSIGLSNGLAYILSIFVIAGLTDWMDGFIARRLGQVSRLGEILDPLADKVLYFSGVMCIAILTQDIVLTTLGLIMVVREFFVSAMRVVLNDASDVSAPLPVSFNAKVKTFVQFLGIGYVFISLQFPGVFPYVFYFIFALAVSFSIISFVGYLKKAQFHLTIQHKTQ